MKSTIWTDLALHTILEFVTLYDLIQVKMGRCVARARRRVASIFQLLYLVLGGSLLPHFHQLMHIPRRRPTNDICLGNIHLLGIHRVEPGHRFSGWPWWHIWRIVTRQELDLLVPIHHDRIVLIFSAHQRCGMAWGRADSLLDALLNALGSLPIGA